MVNSRGPCVHTINNANCRKNIYRTHAATYSTPLSTLFLRLTLSFFLFFDLTKTILSFTYAKQMFCGVSLTYFNWPLQVVPIGRGRNINLKHVCGMNACVSSTKGEGQNYIRHLLFLAFPASQLSVSPDNLVFRRRSLCLLFFKQKTKQKKL